MPSQSFSIEKDNMAFIDQFAGDNKSAFINRLIKEAKERKLDELYAKANREEAQDREAMDEYALWDATLSDGLDT